MTPASDGEFELPDGAVVEGYYVNRWDGKRYPYGRSKTGFWACDEFGWSEWATRGERDGVLLKSEQVLQVGV